MIERHASSMTGRLTSHMPHPPNASASRGAGAPVVESTDAELMALVQAGDRDSFARLVDRYKDPLVRYLARLTGNFSRAEDVAQETFVRLFQTAVDYREQGRFASLLFRIATNLVRSEERRARRWRVLRTLAPVNGHALALSPQTEVLRDEAQRQVAQAIARLPIQFRVPLVLRDVEDWSYEDIAAATGCPEGTVKSRINRARERLRVQLAPYWNGGAS